MFVIGLTGGSGSGKGIVSSVFESAGYLIFDCDAVYHELTSEKTPCTLALADAFGERILTDNGALDRRAMAEIVFAQTEEARSARNTLNRIAHAHVRQAFSLFLSENPEDVIVMDAPLLFEAGMENMCDITVAVIAPEKTRVKRIMMRDNISEAAALQRIESQLTDNEFAARCDMTIENNGTLRQLKATTRKLIKKINARIDNHE